MKSKDQSRKMDDEDTNIFCPNLMDDHYPSRPEELQDMSLYDFLRFFDIINFELKSKNVIWYPYGKQFLQKRDNPHLLNHFKINPKAEPDNYYYSLLLLFKPWRHIDQLKCGSENYIDAFAQCKDDLIYAMRNEHSRKLSRRFGDIHGHIAVLYGLSISHKNAM